MSNGSDEWLGISGERPVVSTKGRFLEGREVGSLGDLAIWRLSDCAKGRAGEQWLRAES